MPTGTPTNDPCFSWQNDCNSHLWWGYLWTIQPKMWSKTRMCDGTYRVWYLPILLHCAFPPLDGIALHTRHDGNLSNLACLRAKMKTNTVLICELMFADNVAFSAHSVPKLQEMCNAFSTSCNLFGFEINIKKTACLLQMAQHLASESMATGWW